MVYKLNSALRNYDEALKILEKATAQKYLKGRFFNIYPNKNQSKISKQELTDIILRVLRARDIVQSTLNTIPWVPTEKLLHLIQLDDRLRIKANVIIKTVPLSNWRISIRANEKDWWWFLKAPEHHLDKLDWLWNMLSIICLTVSVSLVLSISARFLSGGPDVLGALAIVGQSVLTLLTAGTLTEPGRKAIEHTLSQLNRFGLEKYFWQEIKLILSIFLLISLLVFWSRLPTISNFFNERGLDHYVTGELANAQSDFKRAVSLNPNNLSAQYNLGRIYEGLQQLDKAQTSYLIAAQGDYALAYNELGRMSLQVEKLSESAAFLQRGFELIDKLPEGDERNHTTYALFKNLGWVRLEQERYIEAQGLLDQAIDLDHTFPYTPAAAHCLLAQVLEAIKSPKNALSEWEICQSTLIIRNSEEDIWYDLARQRLDQGGEL